MSRDDEILEELKRIRQLLEPKPEVPAPAPKGLWEEFKEFISKYEVMGLAVAFILGLYVSNIVQALVNDLIMPIITIVMPGIEWEAIEIGVFRVGHFIGALIQFLIIAFVIFILVKITKK